MKKVLLLIIAITSIALTGCKSESCPPLYTNLTLALTCDTGDDMDATGARTSVFPVEKLELFTLQTYGSVITKYDIDMTGVQPVLSSGKYTFNVSVQIPFGTYKMWVWGNIDNQEVYMPNKQSIRMLNNELGNWYMLLPASELACDALNKTITADLLTLTAQVATKVDITNYKNGTSFYVSNIYDRVDFNGNYSSSGSLADVLQFERPATTPVPPTKFYIFPQTEAGNNVDISFSYLDNSGGVNSMTKNIDMTTLGSVMITFADPIP